MIKLQVTLFSASGKYKPISTIVEVESLEYYVNNKRAVQKRAVANICHNRRMTIESLKEAGYTLIKAREYDRDKIEQDKRAKAVERAYNKRKEQQNKDKE